jgi:hypothetical protein
VDSGWARCPGWSVTDLTYAPDPAGTRLVAAQTGYVGADNAYQESMPPAELEYTRCEPTSWCAPRTQRREPAGRGRLSRLVTGST